MSIRGEERCECLWRTTVLRTGILEHLKKKNSSINLPVIYTKDKPQQEAEMYGYDHAGKCDPGGGWCVCTSADTTENEPLPVD